MDAKTKTVLIVEDNELNMKLFHDCSTPTATTSFRPRTGWRRSTSLASIVPT